MFNLTQNLMQIHCTTCSVILNVMATQYTCSLNSVCQPHRLVQWSHHCSRVHIPVHSPLLPGYTNVVQTILIILIVAGLFLDRPDAQIEKKKGREWWLNKVLSLWNFLTLLYRKCRLSLIYFEVFKLYLLIKKLSKFNLYSFGFNMIFYLVYNVLL